MAIILTKEFLEVLEIADKLRKEENEDCISEVDIIIAEYMATNSILLNYAETCGVSNETLQEILENLDNGFELSDEEINEAYCIKINEKSYKVSKTVKEIISQIANKNKGDSENTIICMKDFYLSLIQKQTYASRIFTEIEINSTIPREERVGQINNTREKLQNAITQLEELLRRLKKEQKRLSGSVTESEEQLQQPSTLEPDEKITEQTENQKRIMRPKAKKDERAIPKKLEGCLTLLNENMQKGEECEILGRDYETRDVEKILLKTTKRNAILIGEPGVGKTAIVEKLVWDIVNEKCPEQLKNQRVISLNVNGIVAGTHYRGDAEEKFKILTEFLEKNSDVILFIDEIHGILGAGSAGDSNTDLGNALKPILARGQVRIIGATTSYEYEKYFPKDPALKRRFEPVIVKEPKTCEVYPMIKNKIRKLEDSHEALISEELANFCIYVASCYKPYVRNPDRTLDLIDTSMALANLEGTHMVTKEIILKNIERSMNILKETPIEIKESTAYHEVGHYLLGKFSKSLSSRKTIAVTIIPYEDKYMGATVYEPEDILKTFQNKDYFVQSIASLYAGRVAEEFKTGFITAGARSDAEKATMLAKDYVTKYAMADELSRTRVYSKKDKEDVTYLTDEKLKQIDSAIDKILEEGYDLAKKVLEEHRKELDLISQELLGKGILSEEEISELLKN